MAKRNARVFEWLVVAVVISVILALAVNVYRSMLAEVERLSFELAAQNFRSVASAARAEWYVKQSRGQTEAFVDLYARLPGLPHGGGPRDEPVRVYLNRQGWPVNTASVATARDGTLRAKECLELWHGFLARAPSATLTEPGAAQGVAYRVSVEGAGEASRCRYRRVVDGLVRQKFDYFPADGRVEVGSSAE